MRLGKKSQSTINFNYFYGQCLFLLAIVLLVVSLAVNNVYGESRRSRFGNRENIVNSSLASSMRSPPPPITTSATSLLSSFGRLTSDYEFVFFYSSNCPHCLSFAPILKSYSQASGILVRAFAVGGSLKSQYFSDTTVVSQKVIDQFFGAGARISVPTLFILNKRNLHAYPVSSGSLNYQELNIRMKNLVPKILKNEAQY